MKTYFARLLPPRPTFAQTLSPVEAAAMKAHAEYWHGMIAEGKAVTFGLVGDPGGAYGIGVLELDDSADATAITNADPAIKANVGLRYEVNVMPMGAVHR